MREIGRFWAAEQRKANPEEVQRELQVLVSDAPIVALKPTLCKVLRVNWDALKLFLTVSHLWRYAPMGGILGLDWVQAESYLRLLQMTVNPENVLALRVIETAATSELNRSR